MKRLSLFVLLLASFAMRAAEFPVGNIEYGPAPGGKADTAAASDGHDFLVVWQDGRGNNNTLLASRVTAAGAVLDPLGIPIAVDPYTPYPRVVWSGDAYVVVWNTNAGLFAARVSREGQVGPRRRIVDNAALQPGQYVAANGSRIVVGYLRQSSLPYSEVRAAVLDANLNVVSDVQLAGPDVNRNFITIAANGSNFMAAWDAQRGPAGQIEAVRLDANGSPIDETWRVISTGGQPLLASDGDGFVLLVRVVSDAGYGWATRSISFDYERGDLKVAPQSETVNAPSLLWTGAAYAVIAQRSDVGITATRVGADGVPQTPQTIVSGAMLANPSAATNGSRILVAWRDSTPYPNETHQIRAQLFDSTTFAATSANLLLTTSANEQSLPAIAFDGTNQLVVWSEATGLHASRMTPAGASLDGSGILLDDAHAQARVVFDGKTYIVAWIDGSSTIHVRFIGIDGVPGSEIQMPTTGAYDLDLAAAGTSSLLVWTGSTYTIQGARLDRIAHTISSPVQISPPAQLAATPAVRFNGIEYLVAWVELEYGDIVVTGFPLPARIRGTRVSKLLAVRDPGSLLLADTDDADEAPALSSNGTDWLLVWSGSTGIYARRILANGRASAQTRISLVTYGSPRATWDGTRYVVVYRAPYDTNVYRAYVTPAVEATEPVRIATTYSHDTSLSLSRTVGGIAMAYTRWSWAPQIGGVNRVVVNLPVPKDRAVRR